MPLEKIEPFYSYLKQKCIQIYEPSQELSLDKSMQVFKGRSDSKQYMPMKPVKFWFKFFVIAEAATGFAKNFKFYTGKNYEPHIKIDDISNQLISEL